MKASHFKPYDSLCDLVILLLRLKAVRDDKGLSTPEIQLCIIRLCMKSAEDEFVELIQKGLF